MNNYLNINVIIVNYLRSTFQAVIILLFNYIEGDIQGFCKARKILVFISNIDVVPSTFYLATSIFHVRHKKKYFADNLRRSFSTFDSFARID